MEMIMLGIVGLAAGLLASLPLILYFHYNPVVLKGEIGKMMEDWGWDALMPTAMVGPYFYWQVLFVALMVILASVYPIRKIGKLKEMEALKG